MPFGDVPDVKIGIYTQADLTGLTGFTAATKDATRAVEQEAAAMAAANTKAKEIDAEMQARMMAERSTGTSTRSGTPGYHPPAESSDETVKADQMRNVMERRLEINKLLIAGEYAKAEAMKNGLAVEVQAASLMGKGIAEDESYAMAEKHVAAEVAAAKAQEAVAAKAAADAEAKALAEKLAKQEAAAARQAEIQAARLAKQAEAEAAADAATAVSAAKANSMADLKILRDSAMASGQVELADAYQFQISVTKEAQALMAKGVGVQQAYVTATAVVAEADRLEAVEAQKAAAAKLEKAAAARVAAGAEEGEAGAMMMTARAQQETLTLSREIMAGRFTRVPGSASILASQLGFANAMPAILGVSVALMAGFELWKTYRKGVQDTKDELVEFKREAEHAAFAIDMAVNKAKDSAAKFYDELDRIVNKTESITEAMQALNKMQEEAARLSEAVAKTKDAAEESDIRKMKDPIAKAQAEYRLKEEDDARANAEADKAGRLKFKNAEDAAKAAGAAFNDAVAGKDNAQSIEHLKPLVEQATHDQEKAVQDKAAQQKALSRFKALGLNEEDIEKVTSGKFSVEDLVKGRGTKTATISPNGGPELATYSTDYKPPELGFGLGIDSGQKATEFANAFKQFQGSLGGKSYAEQPQRFEHTESNLKTITELFSEAQKKADALGAEFQKLTDELPKLAQQLNEESAKRNQDAREKNIKNLDALSAAYEAAAKRIEDAYKDKPAPQEAIAKDAELKSVIGELSVAIHTLAGAHDAGSTAFQGFGKGGKAPNFDFSPLKDLVKKMHDDVQNQFNKTIHELQSQITSSTAS